MQSPMQRGARSGILWVMAARRDSRAKGEAARHSPTDAERDERVSVEQIDPEDVLKRLLRGKSRMQPPAENGNNGPGEGR